MRIGAMLYFMALGYCIHKYEWDKDAVNLAVDAYGALVDYTADRSARRAEVRSWRRADPQPVTEAAG